MPMVSRRRFVNVVGSVGATAAVSQVAPSWQLAMPGLGATSPLAARDPRYTQGSNGRYSLGTRM